MKKGRSSASSLFGDVPAEPSVQQGPVDVTPLQRPVLATKSMPPPTPPPQTEMQPVALVFLDDPVARRLAVAWKACGGNDKHWLETAGFPAHHQEASRQAKALRANAVCRDGGVTDALALQYINAIIAKQLPAAMKKDKK